MSRPTARTPQIEIDRLCELAAVGADLAGAAFTRLLGEHVFHEVPQVRGPGDPTDPCHWYTGIVFEAEGDLSGLVAIVLPASTRDLALERMLGEADPPGAMVTSALRELGNIVASQTVSAIADTLGATIMLSVPSLVMEDAGVALHALITQRGADLRIESGLKSSDGALSALLVIAPDTPKPDPLDHARGF